MKMIPSPFCFLIANGANIRLQWNGKKKKKEIWAQLYELHQNVNSEQNRSNLYKDKIQGII